MNSVLDASAVLAWLNNEPGAEIVDPSLEDGLITSVNWGEVLYLVSAATRSDPTPTGNDLKRYGLNVVPVNESMAERFVALEAADQRGQQVQAAAGVPARKRKRLSVADMCCLSLGLEIGLPVITGDAYWQTLGLGLVITNCRVES